MNAFAPRVLALTVLALAGCSGDDTQRPAPASGGEGGASLEEAAGRAAPGEAQDPDRREDDQEPLERSVVEIYFPSAEEAGLVAEVREIFQTSAPGDRAKQIVIDLISGPTNVLALPALPQGTQLRQIYVIEDGTAFIDFTDDIREGLGGGSAEELMTVYAVVNSVVLNVVEIKRVGILIDGKPIDTLNGHMDLRRPLLPDLTLILGSVARLGACPRDPTDPITAFA